MQKTCPRCAVAQPLGAFNKRALSADGLTAACSACIAESNRTTYWADPNERRKASARASAARQARFVRDPAYKRAFNLWGGTKRRTKIPPWVKITDFLPLCRKAVRAGPDYVFDHIVPLKHPLVCGLHVPWNLRVVHHKINERKYNKFKV